MEGLLQARLISGTTLPENIYRHPGMLHKSRALRVVIKHCRKMGFREKVPLELFNMLPEKMVVRHHWVHWNYISRQLKDIKPHCLYQGLGSLSDCSSLKDIKKLLESGRRRAKTAFFCLIVIEP